MDVRPLTLHGRVIRLEPLEPRHHADLWRVIEPDRVAYMDRPADRSFEAFCAYLERTRTNPGWCAFAVVVQETGAAIGITCYLDVRTPHRGLEIGSTWIGRAWQSTAVNPEMKYLLLEHAFERLGAIRVQLKTDSRNLLSQRAIEKLGAKREGVLRNHMIMPDGHIRHSVMYSILDDEWPTVKSGLEARLGYAPGRPPAPADS